MQQRIGRAAGADLDHSQAADLTAAVGDHLVLNAPPQSS